MNNALRNYRRALKARLCCRGSTRQRLLDQFDQMSAPFLEEHPVPSQAELTAAFGTPQALAEQLMEEVSDRERRQHRRSQWLVHIAAGAMALLLAGYAVWMTFSAASPADVVETIIVYEEVPK